MAFDFNGVSRWIGLFVALMPALQQAFLAVAAATGGDDTKTAVILAKHLTPGEANASELAPK